MKTTKLITLVAGLLMSVTTLVAQNNDFYSRDIAHDLNAVMPENALNNDDVVEITVNPNWKVLQGIQFQIISNPSGIFSLSNNKLIIVSNTNLSPGNYLVLMKATDGQYFDNFIVNVMVVSESKSVFIDPSNQGPEDGSRAHPYKSIQNVRFSSGNYYFIARSTNQYSDQTVNVVSNMVLGSYGKGTRPVLSSSAYYAFLLEESDNETTIRDIRIKNNGSRTIQINSSDKITIDNCQLGGLDNKCMGIGIRSDGLTSYTKVINCSIDSVDSDGIYLESEYSEIAYNRISNISIKNDDGDGIQLNINAFKTRVHHNYIDMGGYYTIKGIIANTQGQSGDYGPDSYTTIEYNVLIGSSEYASFGILSTGRYDTVRSNFIVVSKSAVEANGINLEDGGYIENNIIKGWERGIYTRGDNLIINNNTIINCYRAIDANSTSTHTVELRNNIFYNIEHDFIASASVNNKIIADYNVYLPGNANWKIQGAEFLTFSALRNAGYEAHGMYTNPKFVDEEQNYQLANGSPCIDKGQNLCYADYYGLQRPQGLADDIGAIEYRESNTTTITVPVAPSSLTSPSQTTSSIVLKWNDNSTTESGFRIYRSLSQTTGFAQIASVASGISTYTDNGLEAGTTYYYRIRAYNDAGYSGYTLVAGFTTTQPPPEAPSDLVLESADFANITLAWKDNSSSESGFIISRSFSPSDQYTELARVPENSTGYTDSTLMADSVYFYKVAAFNDFAISEYTPYISAGLLVRKPPMAPSDLTVISVDYTNASLIWIDNANNETGFELERSIPEADSSVVVHLIKENFTSFSVLDLQPNTTYDLRIRAFNNDGYSDYSNTVRLNTPLLEIPTPPSLLKSQGYTDKSITIRWNDNSDNESGFVIERTLASDPQISVAIDVPANDTVFQDSELNSNTTYMYSVKAVNAAGISSSSNKNIASTLSLAETRRVNENVIAYYNFSYDPDFIIHDLSGYGEPLELIVMDPNYVGWNKNNRLDIQNNTAIVSTAPAKKIVEEIKKTNEFTVECWIKPSETENILNSRIVSLGNDDVEIGFVLNQYVTASTVSKSINYGARIHTESTNAAGYPEFYTKEQMNHIDLYQIVYVRSQDGRESLYINGEKSAEGYRPSSFGNWSDKFFLKLGNEKDMSQPWEGSFYILAFYNTALSEEQIRQNYSATPCDNLLSSHINYTINLYPNPVTDEATIELVPNEISDFNSYTVLRILDAYGKIFSEEVIFNPGTSYTKRINVKDYPPGLYLVQLSSGNNQKSVKFIKQ